jgi:hypothetical protein
MIRHNFICKVVNELIENDFSVFIHNKDRVEECGGWFDSSKKEFTVAMKDRMGYEILIHEYSHFLQWRDRRRYFNKKLKSVEIIFSWIDGKGYDNPTLEKAIKELIELEWDCEMGAIELIRKYNLDVDINEYIKAANAYLLFYHMVYEQGVWCKKSPYSKKIADTMDTALHPLEYYLNPDNLTHKQRVEYEKILR